MGKVRNTLQPWGAGQRLLFIAVAAILVLGMTYRQAGGEDDQAACIRSLFSVRYANVVKDRGQASIDGGDGIVFSLSPADQRGGTPGPSIGRRALVILDKGRKVRGLAESFYTSFSRVEKDATTYWAVEEYTGGTHCCTRFHFLAKSSSDDPIQYLGSTDGTMEPAENPWVCKGKNLYFEDSDIRFVHFHIDYAHSRLYIPRFYRLTPSSVTVSNRPFKDVYRDEIAEVNAEIEEKKRSMGSKSSALLRGDGMRVFADELGPLLVQRTILYLFAREDRRAWETFLKDVRSRYKTAEGVAMLRREIEKLLKETPY